MPNTTAVTMSSDQGKMGGDYRGTREAAAFAGCSDDSIRRLIAAGRLKARRFNKKLYVFWPSLVALCEAATVEAAAS